MNVRDDLSIVLCRPQEMPDHLVERYGLRSGDFDRSVERLCERDIGKRRHDVVGSDRLEQRGR
ncbi:hypothetical protein FQZ97_1220260 [compost metagenome]